MGNAPLSLTMNPRLDAALGEGAAAWENAARHAGLAKAVAWSVQRTAGEVPKEDLHDAIQAVLESVDHDDLAVARAELAELLEETDDALADALWEAVLERGFETGDSEIIFEASSHLSAIADDHGDLLAAGEYFIDFLNWRRGPDHGSDPEAVQTAFDEVIRFAEADGEPKIAALFSFRQVAFTKLVDKDDERASTGDWENDGAPYASWA